MSVTILTEEFITPFKPASSTNWQLGNVGDWLKLELTCQFAVEYRFSPLASLTISDPNELILNDGTNWRDHGFAVGMSCTLKFIVYQTNPNGSITSTTNLITFVVGSVSGSTLYANDAFGSPKTTWGYNFGQIAPVMVNSDKEIANVIVWSDARPQGINFTFGQPTNSQSISGTLASSLDGTITKFVLENAHALSMLSPVQFTHSLNFKSGTSAELVTCEYLGANGHRYNYKIAIIFMLPPFGSIGDMTNETAPDNAKGIEALTANYLIEGLPVYNNPNVRIKNDPKLTQKKGNTGWFDENFNQLPNLFTHTDVVYTNAAGDIVSQLDYANPITVTTTISGVPNVSGASRCQYGFAWYSLDEDDFKSNNYPVHENYKVNTGSQAASLGDVFPVSPTVHAALRTGYSHDGATMDAKDISFVQSGSDIIFTATFVPSAAFTTFMDALSDNERKYVLWVSVGDQAPDTNLGDRVSLRLDFNTMITEPVVIGSWDGLDISFTDHPQVYTDTPIVCGNSMYVEDDFLAKIAFQIDTAVSSTIPIPTAISYGFLAQRNSDDFQFVLDNTTVDLTVYPDPTQFNFDASRGFKLGAGNDKNWIKVDHNAAADSGTLKGVLGWYGFKIRWEDWLKRLNVPSAFYDNTEKKDGLNNDWYHYYQTAGWSLKFFVNIDATLDGNAVRYQNLRNLTILDYNSNSTISTSIKWYRDNNGVKGAQLLGGTDPISGLPLGVIIDGETVWYDIEYTSTGTPWANQAFVDANVYGVNCFEVDGGAGQKAFRQLSSVHLPENDNPIIPIPTKTLAEVTWVSTSKIIVEGRIDSNKLIDATRYKSSGRIGCK